MTRLFLADDHTIVRNGIRAMLAAEADLVVVGEAGNGQELLEKLAAVPADVVLLDVNMPVLDGLATTLRLRTEYPAVRVLVLTMMAHEHIIGQMFNAGASGYVLKNAQQSEILAAIRTVVAGRQFLCSEIGLAMLEKARTPGPGGAGRPVSRLTARELEVLQLLAEGHTTSEISAKLFTSTRTVETHRQNILEKTQTKNTAALIRLAVIEGLLS